MLPLQWVPTFNKDRFYVSQSNACAFEWIECWPWPFNSLWLYGPQGCGKTHLATLWAERHGAPFLPLSFSTSLGDKKHYVIDFGDEELSKFQEKKIFYFLREVDEKKAYCLWVSRVAPTQHSWALCDLASRLRSLMSVSITSPDDFLLGQVLTKSFDDIGWKVSPRIITFLIRRMPRSFASVKRVVCFIQNLPSPSFSLSHLKDIVQLMEQEKIDSLDPTSCELLPNLRGEHHNKITSSTKELKEII